MTYSLLKSFLACIIILAFTAFNHNDSIEKNLNKTAGIKSAKVNFKTKKATLIFDADILNPNDITQIVLNTSNNYSVSDLELID